MRALPLLAALLLALPLSPLAAADPPPTPCVRKVLTYSVIVGCQGTDGRTDATCYYVLGSYPTTEMVCVDTNANERGDVCVVGSYSFTYDPLHRHDDVPACIPGAV